MSFRTACSAAACAVLVTLAPAARAQDWPNRSVLTISPLTAGNAADTVARIVLDQVGRQVGQSFVIENRPGAGGTTGSAAAAKADPDGYTLFLLTASQGSYAALHKSLPYGRRAVPPRRRHQRAAHSVPRSGRGLHRGDDRARRFLFPAGRARAAQYPGREAGGTGGQHAEAGADAAERADGGGGGLSRGAVPVLGRR